MFNFKDLFFIVILCAAVLSATNAEGQNSSYDAVVIRCNFSTANGGGANCNNSSNAYGETLADNVTIIGGQNSRVNVVAANANYNAATQTFAFDAAVQNLIQQSFGTIDGTTLDANGVRLFVQRADANITVANADGSQTFTAANQPFFQFNQIIQPNAVSSAKTLRFNVPNSTVTFTVDFLIATKPAAKIVINEVMANPAPPVEDNYGEYFELYNAGLFAVDLNNFKVGDNTGANPAAPVTVNQSLVINADGYAVFGRSNDRSQNGNIKVDFVYVSSPTSTAFQLSNTADAIRVFAPTGVLLDQVSYSNGGVAAVSGFARELKDPALDNTAVDGVNWVNSNINYNATNKGTPGAKNIIVAAGAVARVNILPAYAITLKLGATRQFAADARDANNNVANTTFVWSSSNPAIATVNANGVVTAVADGIASIRAASANGVVGASDIEVFTPSASAVYRNHLAFGTPFDNDPSDDILLNKPLYSLSYNPRRGGPNWVSWNLNRTHFGDVPRCDCFAPDDALPAAVYHVTTDDYTNSGYNRGHQVQSEERTQTAADNEQTFLMTNILPQRGDLNSGPWSNLENFTNRLVKFQNKELYIISGGIYSSAPATLNDAGKVQIPSSTWKIAVVLPAGKGLADVTSADDVQIIAVNMPNVTGILSRPWTDYRTTINAIEAATGYTFLNALPADIQANVKARTSIGASLPVTISGRITTANGRGVSKAFVTLTDANNQITYAVTNPFGYYRFVNVPTNNNYTVAARHKNLAFTARVVTLYDALNNLNFAANQ